MKAGGGVFGRPAGRAPRRGGERKVKLQPCPWALPPPLQMPHPNSTGGGRAQGRRGPCPARPRRKGCQLQRDVMLCEFGLCTDWCTAVRCPECKWRRDALSRNGPLVAELHVRWTTGPESPIRRLNTANDAASRPSSPVTFSRMPWRLLTGELGRAAPA